MNPWPKTKKNSGTKTKKNSGTKTKKNSGMKTKKNSGTKTKKNSGTKMKKNPWRMKMKNPEMKAKIGGLGPKFLSSMVEEERDLLNHDHEIKEELLGQPYGITL